MKIVAPVQNSGYSNNITLGKAQAAWSSGVTYGASGLGLANRVVTKVDNPSWKRWDIYRSLQAGNLNHAPASSPSWWKLDGYTEYTYDLISPNYAIDDIVELAGAKFQSLKNSNSDFLDVETSWQRLGASNAYAMFDQSAQAQTISNDEIVFNLSGAEGDIDTIVLLNVIGTSVRVVFAAVGYDQTFSLVGFDGGQVKYFSVQLPSTLTGMVSLVDVIVSNANSAVLGATAIGAVIAGVAVDIGGTQWGATLGIQDYSVKTQDDFGNFTIVQRAFSRTANCQVWVERDEVDRVFSLLEDRRATPTLYILSAAIGVSTATVWGFYKDASIALQMGSKSLLSIDLIGLT